MRLESVSKDASEPFDGSHSYFWLELSGIRTNSYQENEGRMHPLGILLTVIILGLFAKYKIYTKIQDFLLKGPTKYITFAGIVFTIISVYCFLVGRVETIKGHYVTGLELIFKHHLFLAQIFLVADVLTIIVLLFNKLIDRFRYALLFSVINLIIWPILGMLEIPIRFPQAGYHIGLFTGLSWMAVLLNILIFGIESNKTKPESRFFRFVRNIGVKIQKQYDERQAKEAKYEEDPASVPREYKRTQNILGISTIIFVGVLISWIIAIGFITNLAGITGYLGLGVIIASYVIWLLFYSRDKKL